MSPRARLTQDRSRQRRDALLDAAMELFAEGGEPAITHRAVARRAGVSTAATTYYFGSIETLVDEALARHMETWLSDLRAFTSHPVPAGFSREDAVARIEEIFAARTPEVARLRLSVYLAATGSETLRPRVVAVLNDVETLVIQLLDQAGVDNAERLARAGIAAIGGSAMGRLAGHHTDREEAEQLFWALRALFLAALTTEDEQDRRLREFRRSRRT